MPHAPLVHPGVPLATAHLVMHAPQLLMSFEVLVSHPLAAFASQFWNGALQTAMPHTPAAQPGEPLATAGHALLHMPQFLMSFEVFASQPLAALASQSWNGIMQAIWPQTLLMHVGLVFMPPGQTLAHMPQFLTSLVRLVSQPSFGFMLQSAKPALHMPMPHTPA